LCYLRRGNPSRVLIFGVEDHHLYYISCFWDVNKQMDTLSSSGKKRQLNGEGVQSMEEDSSKTTKAAYDWAKYSHDVPTAIPSSVNTTPVMGTDINGLTLFEANCEPRKMVTDESTKTIQIRNLNVELTFPICLGILHNTMTVMDCLHRFCEGCITKCLRLGRKECPTCRVKVSSKRRLRADPNLDGIIGVIYPNLDEYEAKEESMILEINKSLMQSGVLVESVERGKVRQALAKRQRIKRVERTQQYSPPPRQERERPVKKEIKKPTVKHDESPTLSRKTPKTSKPPSQSSPPTNKPSSPVNQGPEIGFVLVLHPNETNLSQLPNKYLRTSRQLTIRHLCKFLGKKFNMDYKVFKIGIFPNSPPLAEEMTLDRIDKELWKRNDELPLYYRSNL